MHIHEYSHIHSYSFTVFGGLGGVFMNPASPTEFMNNSLHIHIHQKFREGITLQKTVACESARTLGCQYGRGSIARHTTAHHLVVPVGHGAAPPLLAVVVTRLRAGRAYTPRSSCLGRRREAGHRACDMWSSTSIFRVPD